MQKYYQSHQKLVTSPFIAHEGLVDIILLSQVLSELDIVFNSKPILDLGCGTGLLSSYFKDKDLFYIGTDINIHPNFNKFLTKNVRFIQGNALQIPYLDCSIGTILCVDSFEHYPNLQQAAREMRRVLSTHGQILLSVPNYSNIAGIVKLFLESIGKWERDTWAPFDYWRPQVCENFITPGVIRHVFLRAGFTDIKMIGLQREIKYGLLPWLWHPKCPAKIEVIISKLFHILNFPLARCFPWLSLHTFWKIS